MRYTFLFLILSSVIANAQSPLSSVYDIEPGENFPPDMKKAKTFIDEITSGRTVYNFTPGSSSNGSSVSNIELRSPKPLKFELPYTSGLVLEMYDYQTKTPANKYAFYVRYNFPYKRLEQNFTYDPKIFDLQNYFIKASKITYGSYDKVVKNMLMNLFLKQPYEDRYALFINAINNKYKPNPAIPNIDFKDAKHKLQTMSENANELTNLMVKAFDENLYEVLFTTFIEDKKSSENTTANLKSIFNSGIIDSVDDLYEQTLSIKTEDSGMLYIPAKYIILTDTQQYFPVDLIEVNLSFKTKSLTIAFKSFSPVELTIKGINSGKGIKQPDLEVSSKKLSIIVYEKQTVLLVEDSDKKASHEILIN